MNLKNENKMSKYKSMVDIIIPLLIRESYITRDVKSNKPILVIKNHQYKSIANKIARLFV